MDRIQFPGVASVAFAMRDNCEFTFGSRQFLSRSRTIEAFYSDARIEFHDSHVIRMRSLFPLRELIARVLTVDSRLLYARDFFAARLDTHETVHK